uniref:DNL-type domain-containing protein n=1 Tax=Trichogramma kaykai TaxID=54128 RepID=A0ABD2WC16_9HYME
MNTSRKASKFIAIEEVNSEGKSTVLAELSVLDSTEIETKLSTEKDDDGGDVLEVTYTCPTCDTINQKTCEKSIYETGTIVSRCQGCDDNHVVCDHHGSYNTKGEYKLHAFSERVLIHEKYPQKLPKEILDVIDRYYSKS